MAATCPPLLYPISERQHNGRVQVLAQLEDESNILTHTLDMKQMETRRENMPLESQRRLDLYEFSDKQA